MVTLSSDEEDDEESCSTDGEQKTAKTRPKDRRSRRPTKRNAVIDSSSEESEGSDGENDSDSEGGGRQWHEARKTEVGDADEQPRLRAVAALEGIRTAAEDEESDGGGGRRRCVLTIETGDFCDGKKAQATQGAAAPAMARAPQVWLQIMSETWHNDGDGPSDGSGNESDAHDHDHSGAGWRTETKWLGQQGSSSGVWEILDSLRWG